MPYRYPDDRGKALPRQDRCSTTRSGRRRIDIINQGQPKDLPAGTAFRWDIERI